MAYKHRIRAGYAAHLLLEEDVCTECPAYEEIGRCGTWNACTAHSDKNTIEQFMDFMGWNIQDFLDAVSMIDKREQTKEDFEKEYIKDIANNFPSADWWAEQRILDEEEEDKYKFYFIWTHDFADFKPVKELHKVKPKDLDYLLKSLDQAVDGGVSLYRVATKEEVFRYALAQIKSIIRFPMVTTENGNLDEVDVEYIKRIIQVVLE